ncbi:hypothetical protein BUALT_Bualt15G0072000 [Buddleja alternifolia]|uniref:BED-type domain-containing protein n=1 Tax=Buddleja alternifolia TaxID=168488 RepID=A0AAV6WDX4_9LAMI|nr:hypothetical protein BUALT_Bualt15G0072000 [Buddleja alternifolia]
MASQGVESVQSINHRDDNTEVEMIEIDGDNHEEECATLETDDIQPQESGKRKQTSKVWEHFKKVKVDDIQYAECKYCKIHLKTPPGFGTTGLFKHYQKACKKRPRGLDIRQSLIKTSKKVNGGEELTTHIFSQEYTRSELARMVILHDYPLSIVEHVGFRRYSASLQPSFTMISRNTLKNDIFSIYNDEKVKFYKLLEKLKCRVAITTDMWTASNNKKDFMAITAHFIDDSWRLQSCILRFVYVPAPHTADVLCDLLANALMDCNIDRKVSTITDMAKDMLEKYEKYWDSCHILMGVAAVLDPRVATNLKDTSSVGGSGKSGSMSSGVASVSESEHLDMFDQFVASSSNFSTKASLTSELDFYLEESVLPRTSEFDVLSWWKTNGVKYPNLQKMAKDILAISVSTVASESAFSTSGRLVSPHRNRLHPSTLEALMCARRWLWNEGNGTCSKFSGLEACPTMLDEEEDEESFVET